jgi:hypothetical protein
VPRTSREIASEENVNGELVREYGARNAPIMPSGISSAKR